MRSSLFVMSPLFARRVPVRAIGPAGGLGVKVTVRD
jgi:hypothetical protein